MERRLSMLIAGLIVFLVMAVLWDAFVKPAGRQRPTESAAASSTVVVVSDPTPSGAPRETTATQAFQASPPPLSPQAPGASPDGPSYMELLARSETRRRIRASAGYTYLNEVVAASEDSMLHRWDNRILRPVRVFLAPGTAANFQPIFLDAVRKAFERWQQAGVPVRFNLDADSASAEVHLRWRIQFEIERTGQTDLTWDQDGNLVTAVVALATFDPNGRPLGSEDVRVVALHEIGHLIGLDHSPDSTDIMYATTKVRDLSPRDVASARLLYQLAPGSLR
jgi:YD repeat-containing protein